MAEGADPGKSGKTLQQLQLAGAGDKESFGEVLERYGCRVRHWLREAGIRDLDDLDDLVQEANLKLWRMVPKTSFASVGEFRSYVKMTCTNLARDVGRRKKRSPIVGHRESVESPSGSSLEPAANGRSPSSLAGESAERAARQRRIDAAKLSAPERELMRLREQAHLSWAEIARQQSEGRTVPLTEDGVRVKYSRMLKDKGIGPALP